jgi:gallate decarboxylase subunit D
MVTIRLTKSRRELPTSPIVGPRIRFSRTKKSLRVIAEALFIGDDLLVSIWGGTHPHIGAVALAVSRPSLEDPRVTSATSSVLTRIGHKEDEIVKKVSEDLSAALKTTVVVAAGIHWEGLSEDGIETVRSVCGALVRDLVLRASERKR